MMGRLSFLLLVLLAACGGTGDPGLDLLRATAKSVVLPVVEQRLPSAQAEAVAICVIDNAEKGELITLAKDVGNRPGSRSVQIIATVLQRPATVQCVLRAGVAGGVV